VKGAVVTDDFYIGYEPEMPASLAVRITMTAGALLALALLLAVTLIGAQSGFAEGTFEYGRVRWFEGRVIERPYPALETTGDAGTRWYWLVGPGKRGAADQVKGLEGRRVRLSGSLIERDGDRMIEVVSVVPTSMPSVPLPPPRTVGETTLRGEIVDSKCHLGVMKPGEGATHRDCAVRCLLGTIPPMLVVRGGGDLRRIPLVTPDGRAFLDALPSLAGRPVRIRGTLIERGGRQFLSAAVRDIQVE
jgi:hypothetical protein